MCFVDERTVIVGNYWGELIKFDLETERVTRRTIARNGISSVCTQGSDIVASSYDGALYLVDPADLSSRADAPGDGSARRGAGAGPCLKTRGRDNAIRHPRRSAVRQ